MREGKGLNWERLKVLFMIGDFSLVGEGDENLH